MADQMTGPLARCPWCSAPLPADVGATCPACGATLASTEGADPQLPGLTTIDADAILRARSEGSRPRSRILSFITGETPDAPLDAADAASIAPPTEEVRREMLRLRIEAERAELESQLALAQAQARLEGRLTPDDEDDRDAGPGPVAPAQPEPPADPEPPEDRSAL